MEFEGIVYRKLDPVSGTSAKGGWKKQDVVFELPGEFSRKICVTFFGDRSDDAAALSEGDSVNVSVNVESREYNGKWYTDVKAWKIVRNGGAPASGSGASSSRSHQSSPPFPSENAPFPASAGEEVDDLPF